ncbi:MAG: OmpW family outer membrane protein [Pseudomonadota bacterium]
MKRQTAILGTALLTIGFGTPVLANEAGDWLVKAGPYGVLPKSGNSDIANVDDGFSLGFSGSYFFTDRFAIELLAALPFSHDIELRDGGATVADTKQLPPTLSAQYHFPLSDAARMYVGAGLNYTTFFDESTEGALAGTDLELDDSFGLALQLGADFDLNDKWFLNIDVRYIDIETDAKLDGADLTTVEIDPWVVGFNIGWRL